MKADDAASTRGATSLPGLEPTIRAFCIRFAVTTFGGLALATAWRMWGHWQLLAMVEALILPPGIGFAILGVLLPRREAATSPEEFEHENRAISADFFGLVLLAMGIGGMLTSMHPSLLILFGLTLLAPALVLLAIGRRLRRDLRQRREDRAIWGHAHDQ